ncbi:MAG: zf-HC2 domain-containing protein [Planctomycetes bacterium]|nr:zf-HC2 domain-containing protein [Planctomycetota bacterium]NOG53494.1 zf-HC2 domain-containing protein [Planctomycetota bacterium]
MNLLKKIQFVLNVNCRQASQLLSDKSERPLAGYERAALRFHLFVCGPCRKYALFLLILRDVMMRISAEPNDAVHLSHESRSRIKATLEAHS